MHRLLFAVVLLGSLFSFAQEDDVLVHNGMGTGQDYVNMTSVQRSAYAMGLANGFMLAPLFGAPKDQVTWAEACLEGMNNVQVAEIIAKYIREHPEEWHDGLHINSYRAIREVCP